MNIRRKILFWIFLTASLAFLAVPSVVLLDSIKQFMRTSPEDPGLAPQMSRVGKLPIATQIRGTGPEPQFVRFSLKAPEAKAVFLAGDFNIWKRDQLALKKGSAGNWDLLLPLPPGRYRYRFVADGKDVVDPANPETERVTDETVSIKTVK